MLAVWVATIHYQQMHQSHLGNDGSELPGSLAISIGWHATRFDSAPLTSDVFALIDSNIFYPVSTSTFHTGIFSIAP